MSKPIRKTRFRFSIRTILILFAIVCVVAGLIGRTINDHRREQRIAKRIEDLGADVMFATVPPTDFASRLIYRFGGRKFFGRIVNVEFDFGDEMTDAAAKEIGLLPNLLRLKIEAVPISDEQLAGIAKAPKLKALQIHQDGRILANQRVRQLNSQLNKIELESAAVEMDLDMALADGSRASEGYQAALLELTAKSSRIQEQLLRLAALNKKNNERAITDAGIQSLVNHPELERLTIYGCPVSDKVLGEVLDSLNLEAETQKVLADRRQNEIMLCGAVIRLKPDKGLCSFELRDSIVDFARLDYIIPRNLDWELVFPAHVPLDNSNPGGFRVDDFLKEIKPFEERVTTIAAYRAQEALFEVLSAFPNLDTLDAMSGDNLLSVLPDDSDAANSIRKLQFECRCVLDDDVESITKLKSLKSLDMPLAMLTSHGLKRLMNSELRLDELKLNSCYESCADQLVASGLTTAVEWKRDSLVKAMSKIPHMRELIRTRRSLFSDSGLGISHVVPDETRTADALKNLPVALDIAEFPRPTGKQFRPEDYFLFHQRKLLWELPLFEPSPSERLDSHLELLKATLNRTGEIDVPIEKVIASPPRLQNTYELAELNKSISRAKYELQLSQLFGALAHRYELHEEFEVATEMRIRQFAWQPRFIQGSDDVPGDFQWSAPQKAFLKTKKGERFRGLFFLVADNEPTTLEAPTKTMICDWFQGEPLGVPVFAGTNRQFVSVTSNSESLKVSAPKFKTMVVSGKRTRKTGRYEAKIPPGHDLVFVQRQHFPIKVTVNKRKLITQAELTANELFQLPTITGDGKSETPHSADSPTVFDQPTNHSTQSLPGLHSSQSSIPTPTVPLEPNQN